MTDMPKEIWVVAGADDPSLEYTAMRDKEYETAIKYTRAEPASAGDDLLRELKNVRYNGSQTDYLQERSEKWLWENIDRLIAALAQTPTATDAEARSRKAPT